MLVRLRGRSNRLLQSLHGRLQREPRRHLRRCMRGQGELPARLCNAVQRRRRRLRRCVCDILLCRLREPRQPRVHSRLSRWARAGLREPLRQAGWRPLLRRSADGHRPALPVPRCARHVVARGTRRAGRRRLQRRAHERERPRCRPRVGSGRVRHTSAARGYFLGVRSFLTGGFGGSTFGGSFLGGSTLGGSFFAVAVGVATAVVASSNLP